MFRIPEVRINRGLCFCFRWPILTAAPSELMGVASSCLTLPYRGLCILCVFLHAGIPAEIRENIGRSSPKASADRVCSCLFALILVARGTRLPDDDDDRGQWPITSRDDCLSDVKTTMSEGLPTSARSTLSLFPSLAVAGSASIPSPPFAPS